MMKKVFWVTILLCIALSAQTIAQESPIFPKGEIATNTDNFTGTIWLNHISEADDTFNYNIATATYAPGSKLDWHAHPGGQILLITKGTGYYQERSKSVEIIHKGDVIKCLPGVEHWHGATPESSFAYLAITADQPTKWLEEVSEGKYKSITPPATGSTNAKQEIINLSKKKWQWMAGKNVDALDALFSEQAIFVHMGGTWGKEQELSVIESGNIWYKKAAIHDVSVKIIGETAILLNKIRLLAVVGGQEVINPFMVTEVYVRQGGKWILGSLSFTKLLNP